MTEVDKIAECVQATRGEFRYFAVFDTDDGPIEVTFKRSDQEGKDKGPDATFVAKTFRPEWDGSYPWTWIASLGWAEIESRDVPKHADEPEKYLDLLREDGERLLARAVAILRSDSRRNGAAA